MYPLPLIVSEILFKSNEIGTPCTSDVGISIGTERNKPKLFSKF